MLTEREALEIAKSQEGRRPTVNDPRKAEKTKAAMSPKERAAQERWLADLKRKAAYD